MGIEKDFYFSEEHEWACDNGDGTVTIGISNYAQDALGDIVFVELPEVGEEVERDEEFGVVESVKAVSDLYSPVTGEVVAVNKELEDAPELVNESPYQAGWMIKVRLSDSAELDDLMSLEGYESFVKDDGV